MAAWPLSSLGGLALSVVGPRATFKTWLATSFLAVAIVACLGCQPSSKAYALNPLSEPRSDEDRVWSLRSVLCAIEAAERDELTTGLASELAEPFPGHLGLNLRPTAVAGVSLLQNGKYDFKVDTSEIGSRRAAQRWREWIKRLAVLPNRGDAEVAVRNIARSFRHGMISDGEPNSPSRWKFVCYQAIEDQAAKSLGIKLLDDTANLSSASNPR